MLTERFGVSQRHACRVVGQHRSTQRLDPPTRSEDDEQLRSFLRAFSKERPRWGWRRAAKAARRDGWVVNDKRIQRLWRDEGLKVPYRKRKKPHRGIGTAVGAMCPVAPNALWALDFQFDTTVDGRILKLLNIVDEYTRECPAIVVAPSAGGPRETRPLRTPQAPSKNPAGTSMPGPRLKSHHSRGHQLALPDCSSRCSGISTEQRSVRTNSTRSSAMPCLDLRSESG